MDVKEAARRAVRAHNLLEGERRAIVAVSGGADSLALLHALVMLVRQGTLNIGLIAATLDHGLRGPDGAADTAFVAEFAASLGVACVSGTVDVPALADAESRGVEDAARAGRYRWLASVARAHDSHTVVTAHHADDQAETVLLRLMRGTGTAGLAGMGYCAPLPYDPSLVLIRPLLGVRRAIIDAYCVENGLQPRTDATNTDESLARNWVRQTVIPLLSQRFPETPAHLAALADSAAADQDYLLQSLTAALIRHAALSAQHISIDRSRFETAHPAIQRRYIHWAHHQLETGKELSYERIMAALEHLKHGENGAALQLPGGIEAVRTREHIVIQRPVSEPMHPPTP